MYLYIYTSIFVCACLYIYIYAVFHVSICICVCKYMYMRAQICIYTVLFWFIPSLGWLEAWSLVRPSTGTLPHLLREWCSAPARGDAAESQLQSTDSTGPKYSNTEYAWLLHSESQVWFGV